MQGASEEDDYCNGAESRGYSVSKVHRIEPAADVHEYLIYPTSPHRMDGVTARAGHREIILMREQGNAAAFQLCRVRRGVIVIFSEAQLPDCAPSIIVCCSQLMSCVGASNTVCVGMTPAPSPTGTYRRWRCSQPEQQADDGQDLVISV